MSTSHNQEETIFGKTIQLPPEQRADYLKEVCGSDEQLRERVEALLLAHEQTNALLENPPSALPAKTFMVTPAMIQSTENAGDRIGRYKLLQKIGEGGCGVVYMADQEQPVRRRVALKVIKLGMDTKSVIARFEAERQALALMDHPNIAKVLDAGATEAGRPYFVMELVRGIRITDYCDQNNLTTPERLALFNQVCNAIQHAHQKGIIHRDIKPSNILVTLHDGVPVPKVIDFGIAKATQGRLTDQTLFTAFEQFIGTPAYMSPEQAEMSGLDIDTRSDIYSLGVLLYELLTGQTPFDASELMRAGLDEMRRTIREQEPARPSTRLSTMLNADLTSIAKHRQAEPAKLTNLIRGDLDWIVMKALEKDRTRRYETANGLAADIQRHLQNEPVVARPPSNLYRFQKLIRRNKLAFVAVSAVTAALLMGLGLSTWMFFKEKEARQRAVAAEKAQTQLRQQAEAQEAKTKTEASKSQQVARFLQEMLNSVGPSVALGRDTTMLREILEKTAERVDKDLKNQPEVEAELLSTIGSIYVKLGELEKAEVAAREALRLRQSIFGQTHELVAASQYELAVALSRRGRANDTAEAEAAIRQSLAIRRKLFGNEHAEVANLQVLLAGTLRRQGKLAEAEMASREALVVRKKMFGHEHQTVAASLGNLGMVLRDQGKLSEAEAAIKEALAMQRKLEGNEAVDVSTSLRYLATVLLQQGKLSDAETTAREALRVTRKLYGNTNVYTTSAVIGLAEVLEQQKKLTEAETLYRERLEVARKTGDKTLLNQTTLKLNIMLRDQGKLAEAETLQREDLVLLRKKFGSENPAVLASLGQLGHLLRSQGRHAEAEVIYRERLQGARNSTNAVELNAALVSLGHVLLYQEKFAEVEPILRELLAENEKVNPDHWFVFEDRRMLGISLLGQKKYAEAEPLLLSGYEGLKQRNRSLKESVAGLVQLYEATSRPDQAAEWKKKLAEFGQAESEKKVVAPQP
jgi:serine/threonine protein kinase